MRIYFLMGMMFLSFHTFGQLKGAVQQTNLPAHINEERKPENSTPASLAKNNSDKLTKSLKLTEVQRKALYTAFLDYETNILSTNKSKLSNQQKFKKTNELNKVRQGKLKSILTKEQYSAYILSFP